ncbi:MAG: chemotaxis protein CheW [Cyanobacteria bacterium J06623_4]
MLLFQVEDEPWAIAAAEVKDLVSLATLQALSSAVTEQYQQLAGVLNYHGELLPVIDVSAVIGGQAAPQALSTRIAVVDSDGDDNARYGLVLDRAYETAYLSEKVCLPFPDRYVQAALKGPQGVVRRLAIAPLLNHITQPDALPVDYHHRQFAIQ